MKDKLINVIGLGYIGLPTAALLAGHGYTVVGMDVSEHVVRTISQGKVHIVEPDLDAFVRSAVAEGRLRASTAPQTADIHIICVPTPFHEGGKTPRPNIDYVIAAAKSIAPFVKPGGMVILESTSPVGTTEKIEAVLRQSGVRVEDIHIAYCPERVLPGKIMTELVENDRIVGGMNPVATKVIADFYRTFVSGQVVETEAKTAEMCKLTENSFRDVNIAFANELSLICDKAGINVWNLIQLANRHPRVDILQPGCGVGGHCIAVDPWFIVEQDPEHSNLIRTAREVNNYKSAWVIEKIKNAAWKFESVQKRSARIAIMGLAFKPNIDDLRESPALAVAESLHDAMFDVVAVEPNIDQHEGLKLVSAVDGLNHSDIVVFLVHHREFAALDTTGKLVLDFCGVEAA